MATNIIDLFEQANIPFEVDFSDQEQPMIWLDFEVEIHNRSTEIFRMLVYSIQTHQMREYTRFYVPLLFLQEKRELFEADQSLIGRINFELVNSKLAYDQDVDICLIIDVDKDFQSVSMLNAVFDQIYMDINLVDILLQHEQNKIIEDFQPQALAQAFIQEHDHLELDYSIDGLKRYENQVDDEYRNNLDDEQSLEWMTHHFAAYIGEVFCRQAGAVWFEDETWLLKVDEQVYNPQRMARSFLTNSSTIFPSMILSRISI